MNKKTKYSLLSLILIFGWSLGLYAQGDDSDDGDWSNFRGLFDPDTRHDWFHALSSLLLDVKGGLIVLPSGSVDAAFKQQMEAQAREMGLLGDGSMSPRDIMIANVPRRPGMPTGNTPATDPYLQQLIEEEELYADGGYPTTYTGRHPQHQTVMVIPREEEPEPTEPSMPNFGPEDLTSSVHFPPLGSTQNKKKKGDKKKKGSTTTQSQQSNTGVPPQSDDGLDGYDYWGVVGSKFDTPVSRTTTAVTNGNGGYTGDTDEEEQDMEGGNVDTSNFWDDVPEWGGHDSDTILPNTGSEEVADDNGTIGGNTGTTPQWGPRNSMMQSINLGDARQMEQLRQEQERRQQEEAFKRQQQEMAAQQAELERLKAKEEKAKAKRKEYQKKRRAKKKEERREQNEINATGTTLGGPQLPLPPTTLPPTPPSIPAPSAPINVPGNEGDGVNIGSPNMGGVTLAMIQGANLTPPSDRAVRQLPPPPVRLSELADLMRSIREGNGLRPTETRVTGRQGMGRVVNHTPQENEEEIEEVQERELTLEEQANQRIIGFFAIHDTNPQFYGNQAYELTVHALRAYQTAAATDDPTAISSAAEYLVRMFANLHLLGQDIVAASTDPTGNYPWLNRAGMIDRTIDLLQQAEIAPAFEDVDPIHLDMGNITGSVMLVRNEREQRLQQQEQADEEETKEETPAPAATWGPWWIQNLFGGTQTGGVIPVGNIDLNEQTDEEDGEEDYSNLPELIDSDEENDPLAGLDLDDIEVTELDADIDPLAEDVHDMETLDLVSYLLYHMADAEFMTAVRESIGADEASTNRFELLALTTTIREILRDNFGLAGSADEVFNGVIEAANRLWEQLLPVDAIGGETNEEDDGLEQAITNFQDAWAAFLKTYLLKYCQYGDEDIQAAAIHEVSLRLQTEIEKASTDKVAEVVDYVTNYDDKDNATDEEENDEVAGFIQDLELIIKDEEGGDGKEGDDAPQIIEDYSNETDTTGDGEKDKEEEQTDETQNDTNDTGKEDDQPGKEDDKKDDGNSDEKPSGGGWSLWGWLSGGSKN